MSSSRQPRKRILRRSWIRLSAQLHGQEFIPAANPRSQLCRFESRTDLSSIELQKPMEVKKCYIQLISEEFTHEDVEMGKAVDGVWYTRDEEQFWGKM